MDQARLGLETITLEDVVRAQEELAGSMRALFEAIKATRDGILPIVGDWRLRPRELTGVDPTIEVLRTRSSGPDGGPSVWERTAPAVAADMIPTRLRWYGEGPIYVEGVLSGPRSEIMERIYAMNELSESKFVRVPLDSDHGLHRVD